MKLVGIDPNIIAIIGLQVEGELVGLGRSHPPELHVEISSSYLSSQSVLNFNVVLATAIVTITTKDTFTVSGAIENLQFR